MSWSLAQRAILWAAGISGTMRFGSAMIANHARNGSYACRYFLCVIRLSLSLSLRFRGA